MGGELIKADVGTVFKPAIESASVLASQDMRERLAVASEISKELAKIIKERKLSTDIAGKKHVHVEGWTTMGALLPKMVIPKITKTEEISKGRFKAECVLLAGEQIVGGADGEACVNEGKYELDYKGDIVLDDTGKPKQKLNMYNKPAQGRFPDPSQARSMAQTRAVGKAFRLSFSWIMVMAGYEPTPAEEMYDVVREGEGEKVNNDKAKLWKKVIDMNKVEVANKVIAEKKYKTKDELTDLDYDYILRG